MNKKLLIFNGDYAYNCWKETNPAAEASTLVWRENYLEGPLPAGIPHEDFERIRAEFLHTCVPEYPAEKIYRALLGHHSTLAGFNQPECEIILYFDCCMYDMIMLARIFHLLKNPRAQIRLFCEDVILGCAPEVFRKEISSLRGIPPPIAALYARAWDCILQGPEAIARFNAADTAHAEPFLALAMKRYAEDHPADGSPGRSQKQLLEIVNSGIYAFADIFQAFDKYETYMFMGDTHCLRLLEDLAARGLIRKKDPLGKYPAFYPL